jgi:hypothetical protein
MAIADSQGVVKFAQVGYGQGDEKVWRENIALLAAGKPPNSTTIARERLRAVTGCRLSNCRRSFRENLWR